MRPGQYRTSTRCPQTAAAGEHEARPDLGRQGVEAKGLRIAGFHQGQSLTDEVRGMPPPLGGDWLMDRVALPVVHPIMAGIPDDDDGMAGRTRSDLHTQATGPIDRSSTQSMPQGVFDEGLDHEGRNLLGFHPIGNGQKPPIHRAVHPPQFELDVISEHGPFPVERQPPASTRLNLIDGQAAESPQILQTSFAFATEKVRHDAVEGIEQEMRIHEVAQGIRLNPRELSSLHDGLLRQPTLGPHPGLPMGHFCMTASLFTSEVIADGSVEQKSIARESGDGNEWPRDTRASLDRGHENNDHHQSPEGPPGRAGSEEAPLPPFPPFRPVHPESRQDRSGHHGEGDRPTDSVEPSVGVDKEVHGTKETGRTILPNWRPLPFVGVKVEFVAEGRVSPRKPSAGPASICGCTHP